MTDIEQKLFKSAEGYKDMPSARWQIYREALTLGVEGNEALSVTEKVMKALKKTESVKRGSKFGMAHDPNKQYRNLALVMSKLRY